MAAPAPSPSRRPVPTKPLPPPPSRVAALSGRDAVLGSGTAGQRGPKAHSADADSNSLNVARAEALILHQRSGSDRASPRPIFIPAPTRADSSPDLQQRVGPRGGSHRALTQSPVGGQSAEMVSRELTAEEQEAELLDALMVALQNEESIAVMEDRIRDAAQRQGHQGRVRSGICLSEP